MIDLYLVWIDRPCGLLVVPFLGTDRVDVISRAIDAAKSRWPGSKVHLVRHIGDVNMGDMDEPQLASMLRLSEEFAFQGLDMPSTPAQRRLTDALEELHRVLNQLYAEMRKEPRDQST